MTEDGKEWDQPAQGAYTASVVLGARSTFASAVERQWDLWCEPQDLSQPEA